ncbi:MAG: hypothetical protein SWZ49_10125 [Cyanobacteriota bacterium]|nr:hypothetical protein [Cyanobacteriota bacterium]
MVNKTHLHSFSFEVVTVNRRGEIILLQTKQAMSSPLSFWDLQKPLSFF